MLNLKISGGGRANQLLGCRTEYGETEKRCKERGLPGELKIEWIHTHTLHISHVKQ